MATLGIATINVLARTTQFENSLRRSIKRIGISTAAILGGVGAASFLSGAIKNSIDLGLEIAKIQTLLQDVAPDMRAAFNADSIRALSNEIGIGVDQVATSLYYMIGSGVDAADAMDAVAQAASTAVATTSDLELVANFTSTALNAFGGTVDRLTGSIINAEHANDIFFSALAEGKGTANDLAKYISSAIPAASGLGISLSEVSAAAAATTLTGKSARKVFTGLMYVMESLGDTTKGIGEAFLEITGKSFPEFVKQGGTLKDAIKTLGSEIGIQQLSNMAGAKTGLTAVKELLVVWDKYEDVQKATAKAEGDASAARDIVNESLSRQIDILKNRFKNFQGSVGDWLGPVVADAIRNVDKLREKFNAAWPGIKAGLVGFIDAAKAAAATFWDSFSVPIMFAVQALQNIDWVALGSVIQSVFVGIMAGAAPLISAFLGVSYIISGVMQALAPLVALLNNMKPIVVGVTAAVVAYHLSWYLVATAVRVAALATAAWTVVTKVAAGTMALFRTAMLLWQVATGKATLTQWQLNAALTANPIGAVIALVVGLAAAFIYGWKTSEKFRNIVVKSWNTIKDGTLAAIKVMFNVMFNYFTIPIKLIQKLIGAVGHLPKWLGGGVADQAASAVNNIVAGIEHMKASLDGLIDKAMQADWALNKVYADDMGAQASADALNDPAFLKSLEQAKPKRPGGGGGAAPSFAGGNYDPSGGAEDAAKKAADAIKAAMKRIKADLIRIAKNTSKQTTDTIKQNFETLYADMKDGKVAKKIINQAKKMEKQLLKLAVKRDQITERLNVARDAYKQLTDEAASFTKGIRDQVNALGDVSQATKGYAQTFLGIRNQLRYAVIATERFNANIQRLRELNLNETNLKQLMAAGPEAAGEAARILAASGAAGVNQINQLQSQLTAAGNTLATTGYNEFFANGIQMANGLVKGLESQQEAILKQMDKLGDRIAERFKKKLGIKSPSKVFEGLGEMLPLGLSKGMDSGIKAVNRSGQNMVDASIHFGPGSVSVNGVSDPRAAQRAGILAGAGIKGVLAQKQANQVLDGIG